MTAIANPFRSRAAIRNRSYARPRPSGLVRLYRDREVAPVHRLIHESLRTIVLNADYPCYGAQAAFRAGRYGIGLYAELGAGGSTQGLAHDLFTFTRQQDRWGRHLNTFVASFLEPSDLDEPGFEAGLWRQLQALHDLDRSVHRWDPAVSDDPAAPDFSFSFAGRAFFVVGLHAASSRWSRRFAWPTLVFNAHHQFEFLRRRGQLATMQRRTRDRDRALQGTLNPNLSAFGETSEARQYSGRAVEPGWRCPLHTQDPHTEEETP